MLRSPGWGQITSVRVSTYLFCGSRCRGHKFLFGSRRLYSGSSSSSSSISATGSGGGGDGGSKEEEQKSEEEEKRSHLLEGGVVRRRKFGGYTVVVRSAGRSVGRLGIHSFGWQT